MDDIYGITAMVISDLSKLLMGISLKLSSQWKILMNHSLPSSFQCSLLRCLLIVVVSTCRFELPPHTNIPLLLCQWHAFFTTEKSSSMRILKQFTLMPAYKIVYTLGNVEFYMVSLWASDDAKYNSSYCNRKHGLIKKVMMFGH